MKNKQQLPDGVEYSEEDLRMIEAAEMHGKGDECRESLAIQYRLVIGIGEILAAEFEDYDPLTRQAPTLGALEALSDHLGRMVAMAGLTNASPMDLGDATETAMVSLEHNIMFAAETLKEMVEAEAAQGGHA